MYVPTQPRSVVRIVNSRHGRRGLGASATQAVGLVSSLGTPVVLGAVSSSAAASAAASGTAATILGMAPALAIPIIGAAIAGITIGIELLLNSGCGQTCIVTSDWANQAEDLLRQNAAAYFALPAPRSLVDREAAVGNFDRVWAYLSQQCSAPQLGAAGRNCIGDRQAGACKWRMTNQPQYPGGPRPGDCYNWFSAYRDPIANDAAVSADAVSGVLAAANQAASSAGLPAWLLPVAAAALVAAAVL